MRSNAMDEQVNITLFSTKLLEAVGTLFKLGGFALVYISVGLVLMLIGHLYASPVSAWIFAVGAVINMSYLGLFLFLQLRGPLQTSRVLKENRQLMDTLQETAISLTDVIGKIQTLMLIHSENISRILQQIAPVLGRIPGLNAIDFSAVENTNKLIVDTTERTKEIVDDIQDALIRADVQAFKRYAGELERATTTLKEALRAGGPVVKIPDYKEMSDRLQRNLLGVTDTFDAVQRVALDYIRQTEGFLDKIVVIVDSVPLLRARADRLGLHEVQSLCRQTKSLLIESVDGIDKLRAAIRSGDLDAIATCLKEVEGIGKQVHALSPERQADLSPGAEKGRALSEAEPAPTEPDPHTQGQLDQPNDHDTGGASTFETRT
jgi:hypothetical protein